MELDSCLIDADRTVRYHKICCVWQKRNKKALTEVN